MLFEAPTIEAVRRADRRGGHAAGRRRRRAAATRRPSTVVAPRPRFQHLVAMHPGEGGPKTPFFLVAGMFGNVLNLRHLAHLVGTDRPFYGVQAKGLFGGEEPHDDFRRDGARPTWRRCARCSPTGPYLLGGFSGRRHHRLRDGPAAASRRRGGGLLVFLDTRRRPDRPLRR